MSVFVSRVNKSVEFQEIDVGQFDNGTLVEVQGSGPFITCTLGLISLDGHYVFTHDATVKARVYPAGTEFSISVNAEREL